MTDDFTEADHERARRAGQQAMATQAGKPARERKAHPGWRFLFGWLALTQLVAFGVAVVHLFHSVTWESGFPMVLITWPLLVRPLWVAALAAFAALAALGIVRGALGRRDEGTPAETEETA
jgi:hypothetical protein